MGKFDGILLLTDFDGTLSYKPGVSRENCDAIKYFQSEGGLFSIASGRAPSWLGKMADYYVPNTWCANYNGAILSNFDGEIAAKEPICDDFLEIAKKIYTALPDISLSEFYHLDRSIQFKEKSELDRHSFAEPVYKIGFRVNAEDSDASMEKIRELIDDRYIVFRSWITGIEVQKRGTDKGDALLRIKELLGDRVRLTVAVGDYENDVGMIRNADIGYAVANAVPVAKAAANRLTVDVSEHAIARIVEELEKL